MKKFTGLLLLFFLVCLPFRAEAKIYKPLSPEVVDRPVQIPNETVLPDYLGDLEYAGVINTQADDGYLLKVNCYQHPKFIYSDENGNEEFPYAEFLKFEGGAVYLVGLFFINKENKIELYLDEEAMEKSPSGKLTRTPAEETLFKKMPIKKEKNK